MLRRRGEVRDALDRSSTGTDDADPLTGQFLQRLAGVAIVPPTGMERLPAKGSDSGNAGELGFGLIPVGHRHELGPDLVPVVGPNDPSGTFCFPTDLMNIGLQAGIAVQVIALGTGPAVRKDLGALGVFFRGHVTELFQQRHVDKGFDVAGDPRIPVPVPGATHVGRPVDQPDAFDPALTEPRARQQPTETGTDDRNVDLVDKWLAGELAIHPRVFAEPRELTREPLIDEVD